MSTFGSLLSGETLLQPPQPFGKKLTGCALRQAQALTRKFAKQQRRHPDCQHVSTVVGAALERAGHKVFIIGGVAKASDATDAEPDIHYWLSVNGRAFDPKALLIKPVRYYAYSGEWRWDVEEALNNGVEECTVL